MWRTLIKNYLVAFCDATTQLAFEKILLGRFLVEKSTRDLRVGTNKIKGSKQQK